jgi:hypothetical protein
MIDDEDLFDECLLEWARNRAAWIVAKVARVAAEKGRDEAEALRGLKDQLFVLSVAVENWQSERAGLIEDGLWPWPPESEEEDGGSDG